MKRFLVQVFFYFAIFTSFSQTGTSIIFQNGDTLRDSKIDTKFKKTNSQKITFEINGQTKVASVDDVIAYWDGEKYYSRKETSDVESHFVNQLLNGPLTLGEFTSETGEITFVVKLSDEEMFMKIPNSGSSLNPFFSSYLPQYAEYKEEHPLPIYTVYTRKSIGEFVSRYNQFRNPEKYKFIEFKHEKKFYFGVSLLSTSNSFSTDLGSFESVSNVGLGLSGRISVSPKFSFMGLFGKIKNDAHDGANKLIVNSTFFESHILYSLTNSSKLNVLLSSNFTLLINSNSLYKISRVTPQGIYIDNSRVESVSTGIGLNLVLTYPWQHINTAFIAGIGKRSIDPNQNGFTSKELADESKIVRLGLMVEF